MRVLGDGGDEARTSASVVCLQLEAAITGVGQPLPACRNLIEVNHLDAKPPQVKAELEAALEEVRTALARR
jgi:hypothetical protein